MWNSYNILTFTILRHFRTVPMGTVRILWFFLVLRNFWVGTVKKTTLYNSPTQRSQSNPNPSIHIWVKILRAYRVSFQCHFFVFLSTYHSNGPSFKNIARGTFRTQLNVSRKALLRFFFKFLQSYYS